ncbi:mas-related G-protein coupled receptor member A1-like [Anolis carolinensis]|uniref:mas-related G-protein coupled receptor member A1-like n=1 Tax=Anolis carolinensis TaxID=28377 RepID=UPI002F2B3939
MTKFSKSLYSSVNISLEYNVTENIMDYNEYTFLYYDDNTFPENWNNDIVSIIMLLICLPGLVGNGIVIWLLGFRIKRTPFTTYILNLSIADFAVLNNEVIRDIFSLFSLFNPNFLSDYFSFFYYAIFMLTFTASQYLMSIISIDRCVCLFFPLWHRCHRPTHLSTALCVIVWIFSFLTTAISHTLSLNGYDHIVYIQLILNAVVCMPIMCVSTIAIFIKFCLRPPQKKKGKLLRTIWLTLLFFLLFSFPFNIIHVFSIPCGHYCFLYEYSYMCVSVNSAINPMIYYLVGRDKGGRSNNQINKVLQKLFKEEEDYCRGNQEI